MKNSIIIISLVLLAACTNKRSPIPDMPVNLDFNIISTAPQLTSLGGFCEFTEPKKAADLLGYGGIVVFHAFDDVYCAFDMSCPVEAEPNIRVYSDNTGTARCGKCGAEFFLGDGNAFPIKENSKFPLRKYRVYFNAAYNNIYVTR
ncbi:MAG: hypothetical protein LBS50_02055 [Prevotellaceae bacterium]|jgi:hypothetical protein|nr:hypothetical protein [Prevotellaceae bacterium]